METKINKRKKNFLTKPLFKSKYLNTFYLKQFRCDANNIYQVWKKGNKFYVAVDVIEYYGKLYAEETIPFDNVNDAKNYCDKLRYDFISYEVSKLKSLKKVY